MIREEAITELNTFKILAKSESGKNALDMAIKVLSQEPCDVPDINVGDMISRQAVIDILDDMTKDYAKSNDFEKVNGVAWVKVQKLPSVNPQKIGHWIEVTNGRGGHECSLCHEYAPSYQNGDEWLTKYCPNCSAKMESEG